MPKRPDPTDPPTMNLRDFYVSPQGPDCKAPGDGDTKFKKGKSGNPRGRPKKHPMPALTTLDALHEAALRIGHEPVKVKNEKGKVERVSMIEGILRRDAQKALQGNEAAMKRFLDFHRRAAIAQTNQRDTCREMVVTYLHAAKGGKYMHLTEGLQANLVDMAWLYAPDLAAEVEATIEKYKKMPRQEQMTVGVLVVRPPETKAEDKEQEPK